MQKTNKKIFCGITAVMVIVMMFGCVAGGYWNNVDIDLIITPNNPTPRSDITVKCSNYDLFDYETVEQNTSGSCDETTFYNGCFGLCQNFLTVNGLEYNYFSREAVTFKEKKSNREAVYTLTSNVVSSCIITDSEFIRKSTADGCDKNRLYYDNLICHPSFLHISYPQELTFNKSGNTVTVTSAKPFFDVTTFSKNKAEKLVNIGYNIVWYSAKDVIPEGYVYYPNHNIDKKPVPKKNIDLDTLTPTSVTFTIPDDAITGTIHVINEGGFVVDETNDIGLVGNVANAPAYYSTAAVLTITK